MLIKKISLRDQVIMGKQAIKDKNYELGLRCLDKVFVLYPNHTETKLQIRKLLKKKYYRKLLENRENYKSLLVKEEITKKNFAIAKHLILFLLKKNEQEKQLINYLAKCETELGNFEEAIKTYKRLINIDKYDIEAKQNLGNLYLTLGIREEAEKLYLSIIDENPFETEAHRLLASIKRNVSKNDAHIIQMQNLLTKDGVSRELKINLGFALGNTFEKLKDYKKSYSYYKIGNELQHQSINFDLNKEQFYIEQIIDSFNREKINLLKQYGSKDNRLIFILGMPRSGTSLIEQILSSHQKIFGAGELSFIEDYLYENRGVLGLRIPSIIKEPNPERIQKFARYYINQINLLNSSSRYITDKMPGNFRWIGLIKSAFPYSKIIHVNRNAMDNCFSIFKSYFANQTCGYSYHQRTLGIYYNLYKKTMRCWENLFGDEIFNCAYEELVQNPESVSKAMIKYLGLDWDNQVLNFHKNKRRVNTISALQVREKTYTKSINLWKKYKEELSELYKITTKTNLKF